jgi:hypothetical protein
MKAYFLIISSTFLSLTVLAQESKWQIRTEAIKPINMFSFSNTTFNGFDTPKNFGFAVGVERDWRKRKITRLYQSATIGFYSEAYFERVVTLESNWGASYTISKGFNAGFEVGAAYHRAKASNLISVRENNKWVSKTNTGETVNRFVPNIGLNAGYDFSKHFKGKMPISISILSNANLLTPFIKGVAPVGLYRNNKLAGI